MISRAKQLWRFSVGTIFLFSVTFVAPPANAQTVLFEKIEDALFIQSANGFFRSDLSGLVDLEGYYIDQRPPAILFGNDSFFNPRLSLFLDTHLGSHFYSLVQGRFDRGFDPRAALHSARFDEYLLRWTPLDDARINLQVGKSATVVGNWVSRHDSWANPFINAPLAYEYITAVSDVTVPAKSAALLSRQNIPDKKATWLPVIWGPSYATGASVFGSVRQFDYALEIKNAGIASRPTVWDANDNSLDFPSISGRVGWRPNAQWNLGSSFSEGPYLLPTTTSLPSGTTIRDFQQITFAQDVSWAWHHWQLWAEIFESRFQVPNVGDADTLSYYLEAKYKLTPRLFIAARWNQQLFGQVPDGAGGMQQWDRDVWRADGALGFRFNRHWQTKLQYSFQQQTSTAPQQGQQLLAAQLTLKF